MAKKLNFPYSSDRKVKLEDKGDGAAYVKIFFKNNSGQANRERSPG